MFDVVDGFIASYMFSLWPGSLLLTRFCASGQYSRHEREVPPSGEPIIIAVLLDERPGQDSLLLHLLAGGVYQGLSSAPNVLVVPYNKA